MSDCELSHSDSGLSDSDLENENKLLSESHPDRCYALCMEVVRRTWDPVSRQGCDEPVEGVLQHYFTMPHGLANAMKDLKIFIKEEEEKKIITPCIKFRQRIYRFGVLIYALLYLYSLIFTIKCAIKLFWYNEPLYSRW